MEALLASPEAKLRDLPLKLESSELRDPISGRLFGHSYHFAFESAGQLRERKIVCLGRLTPINFLFYGVATELIDEVLRELLQSALGLVTQCEDARVRPCLHAVDRDIDADGNPIAVASDRS